MVVSRISKANEERLKESILRVLYDFYPGMLWTYQIAEEIVRDDEFVLRLLNDLHNKQVVDFRRESAGKNIKKRWGLNKEVYDKYKELL